MTAVRKELRGRRKPLWFAAMLVALAATVVFVVGSSANLAGSTFEGNDGNLVVDTTGNTDWVNAPNREIGTDLPTGTTDNSFGQGAKEDLINTTVVSGSIPNNKADLAQFYVGSEQQAAGIFLYLGWTRANTGGTTNFDFEINQAAQPLLTTPGPKVLNRTVGDLLINYLFQGQGTPQIAIRTWNGSAWSAPVDASSFSEAAINSTGPVANPLPGALQNPTPTNQFGEAAINLTAGGFFPPGVCRAFGSAYVKTRSSTAFNSEIKDFIAPVHISVANCATIVVEKVTVPSPDPTNTSFSFTSDYNGNFSLKNGESNTKTDLNPGTYSVGETVPANWELTSATCDDGSDPSAIDLGNAETVTCTFTNTLQLGAIKVSKTAKHAAAEGGSIPQEGVSFTVNGVTQQTDANGETCFDGLQQGSYDVVETVPAGYHSDDADATKTVVVDNAASCSDDPYGGESVSFTNIPLTDITINVHSQVDGGTASTIDCDGETGSTDEHGDGSVARVDLEPGEYHCTVVVDP
jgi:hypothetical protein